MPRKDVLQQISQVVVVRLVLKPQVLAVIQKADQLLGKALAQRLAGGGNLLFHDLFILVLLVGCLQILPGQAAPEKIHHHIHYAF